jgi:CRISPR system Cascade subunit CasA
VTLSFNLVDEPFLPCLRHDGSVAELGLKDALLQSPGIREIRDASPLVTISLHRLLLAILHRNFGPESLSDWKKLWEARQFDAATLERYFRKWHDRFDLFDQEHPFYQTAGLETDQPLPAAALLDEIACGNNPTLFDHTADTPPVPLSPARAACGVIARQAFAIGFGKSPTCRIRGKKADVGYRKDGPMTRGLTLVMRGDSLFETLLCNLSPPEGGAADVPVWERSDPEEVAGASQPFGAADLYTWQGRRLLLVTPRQQGESVLLERVHFAQGRALDKAAVDPMKPYRKDDKEGWTPLPLSEHRALWRDSPALFQLADIADRPVAALNWIARAVREGLLPGGRVHSLDAFGLCTEPGKAGSLWLWRHDRLPLPLAYLNDVELVDSLRSALAQAEAAGKALRSAIWSLARLVLVPDESKQLNDKQMKDVGHMADSLQGDRLYWSRLEVPFRQLLVELPGDLDNQDRAAARWACEVLCRQAWAAFEETAGALDNSARVLRAVVRARRSLNAELAKIADPYKEVLDGEDQRD